MTRVASIARLKVTLDDVGPKVLRRLEVPFDLRLIPDPRKSDSLGVPKAAQV